jgi:predicted nucleic acid-binding protein
MSKASVVVADTTPLHYLVLIGQAEVLRSLFGEVMIPEAVLDELQHPNAPPAITAWLQSPPQWLSVEKVGHVDESIQLGRGEKEAISLAIERRVPIVLMDERRGRKAAEARGLLAVGTLNILDVADERDIKLNAAPRDVRRVLRVAQRVQRAMPNRLRDIQPAKHRAHGIRADDSQLRAVALDAVTLRGGFGVLADRQRDTNRRPVLAHRYPLRRSLTPDFLGGKSPRPARRRVVGETQLCGQCGN